MFSVECLAFSYIERLFRLRSIDFHLRFDVMDGFLISPLASKTLINFYRPEIMWLAKTNMCVCSFDLLCA